MDDVKPGWVTSEFWVTVLTAVIALISMFQTDFGTDVDNNWGAAVPAVATAIAGIASLVYTHSRSKVKAASLMSKQTVVHVTNDAGGIVGG